MDSTTPAPISVEQIQTLHSKDCLTDTVLYMAQSLDPTYMSTSESVADIVINVCKAFQTAILRSADAHRNPSSHGHRLLALTPEDVERGNSANSNAAPLLSKDSLIELLPELLTLHSNPAQLFSNRAAADIENSARLRRAQWLRILNSFQLDGRSQKDRMERLYAYMRTKYGAPIPGEVIPGDRQFLAYSIAWIASHLYLFWGRDHFTGEDVSEDDDSA